MELRNCKKYGDIPYFSENGTTLLVDFYAPEKEEMNAPCVVFFHGGGWIDGVKEDVCWFPMIAETLIRNGYVVASAQYRLVGKNGGGFPQTVEDVIRVLEFIDRQSVVSVDKTRKAVWGISAGGHLALMSALYQHHTDMQSPVKAIVDMCGITYLCGSAYSFNDPPTTKGFIKGLMGDFENESGNPLDLLKTCPQRPAMIIIQGDSDECVDPDNSRVLYRLATEYGYKTEYIEVKNGMHTFNPTPGNRINPSMTEISNRICNFIKDNV